MQASNLFFASKKKWDEATFFKEFGPNETELFISSANLRTEQGELIPGPIGVCLDKSKIDDYPRADDIVTVIVLIDASGPGNEVLLQS